MRILFTPGLAVLFLFITQPIWAQLAVPDSAWKKVEQRISKDEDVRDALLQVERFIHLSADANDVSGEARGYYDRLLITDKITEDTLYFQNFYPMDSILSSQAPPSLKSIVEIFKARRINEYRSSFFNSKRKGLFRSLDTTVHYDQLSGDQLDSLVKVHLDLALEGGDCCMSGDGSALMWFIGYPRDIIFRPKFEDAIHAARIQVLVSKWFADVTMPGPWLSLPPEAFRQLPDTFHGFTVQAQGVWAEYRKWMAFLDAQGDTNNANYVETLAHWFMYNFHYRDSAAQEAYQVYLEGIAGSSNPMVRAHAVYQLGLMWKERGEEYDKDRDTHKNYRDYYSRALGLFDANKTLLDSFPVFAESVRLLKEDILAPSLSIRVARMVRPGKPILSEITYRNARKIHLKIVRIPSTIGSEPGFDKSPLREITQSLPEQEDHQPHTAFLKLDSLPIGKYAIVYWLSDTVPSIFSPWIDEVNIHVTSIGALYNGERLYVLGRDSGRPLMGAFVYDHQEVKRVNGEGWVPWKDGDTARIIYGGDTLEQRMRGGAQDMVRGAYDTSVDDDILEYYEEHTRIHMFTDRAIYRPGQKVYYKGIFITQNPSSGEDMVLNDHNIPPRVFQKLLSRLGDEGKRKKMGIVLENPFSDAVDSAWVSPNRYGTFSGTFTLPVLAATGNWRFETDRGTSVEMNWQGSRFQVEEYKRPTYELALEKPVHSIKLLDTFSVKVSARTFAGAPLARTKVSFRVSRPEFGRDGRYAKDFELEGYGFTDAAGEFRIAIVDTGLRPADIDSNAQRTGNYEISVTAVDLTGQSQKASLYLAVSNRPVTITGNLQKAFDGSGINDVYIGARDAFEGPVAKPVRVRIFRINRDTGMLGKDQSWGHDHDVDLYPAGQLEQWFPEVSFHDSKREESRNEVYDTTWEAGGQQRFIFPKVISESGEYVMELTCMEKGQIVGKRSISFSVFDSRKGTFPANKDMFNFLPVANPAPGKPFTWFTAQQDPGVYSIYCLSWYSKKNGSLHQKVHAVTESAGLHNVSFVMPKDAFGRVELTRIYIKNNNVHSSAESIWIPEVKPQLAIDIDEYRKRLVPGGKETFVVSVSSASLKVAAELMTGMYDASLDPLAKNEWQIPLENKTPIVEYPWGYDESYLKDYGTVAAPQRQNRDIFERPYYMYGALEGTAAGVSIYEPAQGAQNVVVVGYGKAKAMTGTIQTVTIKGISSLSAYKRMLIIVDGKEISDITKVDPALITDGIILSPADGMAIYGSKAAGGLVILSTHGPVQLPVPPKETAPPLVIRKNFAETAFFYPQLYADRDGKYRFTFTLPESITKWRWMLMAHTAGGEFAYQERYLVSQLPLVVQPSMPRFLYQGDRIAVKSRITNMDSSAQAGELRCVVEDAVTGEDVSALFAKEAVKPFHVEGGSTTSGSFDLHVPKDYLHPLRIRISARSGSFSDGEEHMLPILSRMMLASTEVPISLTGGSRQVVKAPALPADAVPYGSALFIQPRPERAMLDGLPFLANCPYGCAEQTLNRIIAYSLAQEVAQPDSGIRRQLHSIDGAHSEQRTSAEESPDAPQEAIMPWLRLNHAESRQQQDLRHLLDTSFDRTQIEKYVAVLSAMQNTDGGMTWFPGGPSDLYISLYVMGGLGRWTCTGPGMAGGQVNPALAALAGKMLPALSRYCDEKVAGDSSYLMAGSNTWDGMVGIMYAYARTYWLMEFPISAKYEGTFTAVFQRLKDDPESLSLGSRAMLAGAAIRYGREPYTSAAVAALESIRQMAISDSAGGVRWKQMADQDDLNTSDEEDIVRLGEAFDATGKLSSVTGGILTWLLGAQSDYRWGSTKATADVLSLLYRHDPGNLAKAPQGLNAAFPDGRRLVVTDNLVTGRRYAFDSSGTAPFPEKLTVEKTDKGVANGGVTFYYFTANPPVSKAGQGVSLVRKLERYAGTRNRWEAVADTTVLQPGDRIRSTLTITASKRLRYVLIEDKRAACMEPAETESGYKWGEALSYYQSVRDEGMQFFASLVPAGTSTVTYEMVVKDEGEFSCAPASLQCMYRPEVRAYSEPASIKAF